MLSTERLASLSLLVRVVSLISVPIVAKALRLSSLARRDSTTGEIVNLMAIDAQRFMDLATYVHMLWSALLQIILSIVFLYLSMGPAVFAGVFVMIVLIPINACIAAISRRFQVRILFFPLHDI